MKHRIRFKEFEGKWNYKSFLETFEMLKNNSLSRVELSDYGRVRNVHYGDILIKFGECLELGSIDVPFIKDEIVAKKLLQVCPLKNGDVVFADAAEDNTVGKCSEIVTVGNEDVVSGLHTIPCRPKFDFAERYLGYFLNSSSFHDQLLPHIQGTKVSSISRKTMTNTYIYYPSDIKEQKYLSKFFKFQNFLIFTSTSRLASLKQIRAASLQSMFPQEGETTPRIRFKGFEGKWEKVQLANIFNERHEISTITDELPQLSFTIAEGVIYPGDRKSNKRDFLIKDKGSKKYLVTFVDDIIYNPANVVYGAIHRNSLCNGVVSPIYKIFSTEQDSLFMECVIRRPSFISQLAMRTEGTVTKLKTLKPESFLEMDVMIAPSLDEQREIGKYFKTLDRQITLQTRRLEKLKQIKATCLDKMFV